MADHHSLDWRGETPVSTRFDDPYFSLENGLDETRHVFLQGNGLPDRFCGGFQIAELGFGTGLNLLAALQLWRQTGITGQLRFTTFEAFPLSAPDMTRAQAAFDDVAEIASELAPHWGKNTFEIADLWFEMVEGDARETLPQWQGKADAWFLDGFSPAKNPELWSPELMAEVGAHMAPGASAATYTAAGHVRRGLVAAGLEVTRLPGYGRKRHMTRAIKPA
ncbi:tRNA (5-methylaminomethyl-2-thiouridine)(34)-methyltransferase MnmD [uncultured Pelagimonas sp.]|uniref:tRNA (5-methylaminomethyl-2-thiouridine)(34)-methyltransferase MnmD n=1 Tax=uncultured Pelagimonas sp. TaxID=1618102 RepID=UPI0026077149|nr:tRNA (5-methylaminomethyl-2-thiouridine)(34)-methyltransferase MnmD [uncultured Pelagimonas sp.]